MISKKQSKLIDALLNAEAELLISFGYIKDERPGNFWLTPDREGSLFISNAIADLKSQLSEDSDLRKKGII